MNEDPPIRPVGSKLEKPLTRRDFLKLILDTSTLVRVGALGLFGLTVYNFNKTSVEAELAELTPLLKNIAAKLEMLKTSALRGANPISLEKATKDFDALIADLRGVIIEARTDEVKQKLLSKNLLKIKEQAQQLETRVLALFERGRLET